MRRALAAAGEGGEEVEGGEGRLLVGEGRGGDEGERGRRGATREGGKLSWKKNNDPMGLATSHGFLILWLNEPNSS